MAADATRLLARAVESYLEARRIGLLGPVPTLSNSKGPSLRMPEQGVVELALGPFTEGIASLPLLRGMLLRSLDEIEEVSIEFIWEHVDGVAKAEIGYLVQLPWPVSLIQLPMDFLKVHDVAIYNPGDPVYLELEFASPLDPPRQWFVEHSFRVFDAVADGGLPSRPSTSCGSIIGEGTKWFLTPDLFVASWEGILAHEAWVVLIQNYLATNRERLNPRGLTVT